MTQQTIAVEIDHSRLLTVLPLERRARGNVDLTTIAANQTRAIIRLFVAADGSRQLLATLQIDNLSRFNRARPTIRLRAAVARSGELTARVVVEDQTVLERTIDVSRYLPRRAFPWAAAAFILVLILAGSGAFLLLRRSATHPAQPAPAVSRTEPREEARRATPPAAAEAIQVTEQQWIVYFAADSAELRPDTQRELRRIAEIVASYRPEQVRITIGGHCAPAGPERGRVALSRERAQAVARFLQDFGAPPADEVAGYSSDRPVSLEDDRLHLNRRVEIEIAPQS